MIKKLKNRRGTTIVEMLVAVVLLALLTAGGIAAAAAVMTSYIHMREVSNAEILASTVIETLSNEIRLGRNITDPGEGGSDILTLDSSFFGEDTAITLDADKRLVAQRTGSTDKQLLSKSAYHGLHLENLTFTAKKDESGAPDARMVYTIGFAVCNSSDHELWNDSSAAVPMQ